MAMIIAVWYNWTPDDNEIKDGNDDEKVKRHKSKSCSPAISQSPMTCTTLYLARVRVWMGKQSGQWKFKIFHFCRGKEDFLKTANFWPHHPTTIQLLTQESNRINGKCVLYHTCIKEQTMQLQSFPADHLQAAKKGNIATSISLFISSLQKRNQSATRSDFSLPQRFLPVCNFIFISAWANFICMG